MWYKSLIALETLYTQSGSEMNFKQKASLCFYNRQTINFDVQLCFLFHISLTKGPFKTSVLCLYM